MSENSAVGKVFELSLGQRVVFKLPGSCDLEVFVTGIYRMPEGQSQQYVFSALPSGYRPSILSRNEAMILMLEGKLQVLSGPSEPALDSK